MLIRYPISILLCLISFSRIFAAEVHRLDNVVLQTESTQFFSTRPFCGINSMYAALRYLGVQIELTDLMKSDYLGSSDGSSFSDLIRAADDFHVNHIALKGLSATTLVKFHSPAILHVKSDPFGTKVDHYIALLRSAPGGRLVVIDAPEDPKIITYDDLATVWTGEAIVLSRNSISRPPVWSQISDLVWSIPILLLFLWIAERFLKAVTLKWTTTYIKSSIVVAIIQVNSVLMISLILTAVNWSFASVDPLRSELAFNVPEPALLDEHKNIPIISDAELRRHINQYIIVDARLPVDYLGGHLPGALNISITTTRSSRRAILSSVKSNDKIVVYCQSSMCGYSDEVAQMLADDGYNNVAVYTEGWLGWQAETHSH